MKIAHWFSLCLIFLVMALVGAWLIDISVSALLINKEIDQGRFDTRGDRMILSNGFWALDPAQGYHIGLWTVIISTTELCLIGIYLVHHLDRLRNP